MSQGTKSIIKLFPGFYLFYSRIFIPAAISSLLIAITNFALGGIDFWGMVGYSYLIVAPAFHFVLYDFMDSGQYFFYNNLGFTRLSLWILSICISFIVFIILSAL